jgi:hypothetical protein
MATSHTGKSTAPSNHSNPSQSRHKDTKTCKKPSLTRRGALQHFMFSLPWTHSQVSHFHEPISHATPADPLDRFLALNRLYAQHTTAADPNAFVDLAKGQAPEILWLGCSDSRLSESTICQCKPGDIFVHRNIANTVHADDINSASVVEYAVAHLKVKKVVVCGHTKCGGATAALGDADLGQTLNTWLHPVRE